MKTIRRNTFETNSSSTHSLTMCTKSDYEKWKNGELYYCKENEKFYNESERFDRIKELIICDRAQYHSEQIDMENGRKSWIASYTYKGVTVENIEKLYTKENLEEITKNDVEEFLMANSYSYEIPLTYKEYKDSLDLEDYEDEYTTPNGETVVAFGYYGYDG